MSKDRENKEGEELIPEVEPRRNMPSEKDMDPMPDRDLEYKENSNEKYRDNTQQKD
ncbi:hypothetical protein [Planococcus sp. CPCC 101016]|uniref:hypothetical protein n=1 Tax=Planococcus sp. CPCC 101016 TaxID=2599617 RepID=UPI0016457604|nr:hypothetical protein [Planococcus sp. CPCC 101016]